MPLICIILSQFEKFNETPFLLIKNALFIVWCKKMEDNSGLRRANCRAKGGAPGFKVAILGAAGGIGQPLAMLMKMNPLVSVLHLYDVVNAPGVTADISHMDTGAVVIFLLWLTLSICFISLVNWLLSLKL